MSGRDRKLRALFCLTWLSVAGGAALGHATTGCNDAPLIGVPPCRPGLCTCEEDPTQPTCRGFNEPPEGGKDPGDANRIDTGFDASPDAELDGSDDAADAAD